VTKAGPIKVRVIKLLGLPHVAALAMSRVVSVSWPAARMPGDLFPDGSLEKPIGDPGQQSGVPHRPRERRSGR
jgi:hypothetical protein